MNCDHVFAVLTSGPFPRGIPSDTDVERHLEACPSCWQIAEALRPSANLVVEALPPAQARLLPSYHCQVKSPATVISQNGEPSARSARPCSANRAHALPHSASFGPTNHPQLAVPTYPIQGTSSWIEVARVAVFFASVALLAFVACYWLR